MSILTIDNILRNIKDIRMSILALDTDERTVDQNEAIEDMKQNINDFDHNTRVLEFEINKDI